MFTGLVEDMGTILTLEYDERGGCVLTIATQTGSSILDGVKEGDSISVNGVCLTVTSYSAEGQRWWWTAGLAPETLRRTNLGQLKVGDPVNLERSLRANGKVGGHFVQGHIDGTGKIIAMEEEKDSLWFTVEVPFSLIKYIVEKAYIAIDGTSLTVCDVHVDPDREGGSHWFKFMLVAYTQQRVVLPRKKVGDLVNLEVDIMAKYVERFLLLSQNHQSPLLEGISRNLLGEQQEQGKRARKNTRS